MISEVKMAFCAYGGVCMWLMKSQYSISDLQNNSVSSKRSCSIIGLLLVVYNTILCIWGIYLYKMSINLYSKFSSEDLENSMDLTD